MRAVTLLALWFTVYGNINKTGKKCPDSLVVRASASGAVDRGFGPGRAIPKALKMVLVAPLLRLALKGSDRR